MEFDKLIQRCIHGDERAMHELYKSCFQTMMRVTRRYSSSNDDAVAWMNLSFFKVVNNLSSFKPEENFDAWIKRIAINTSIDECRKIKRYRNHVKASEEQSAYALETNGRVYNDGLHKLNAEEIIELINALPDTTREVFNLFAIDGYNHKEISGMLGITEVTSRWYLHKARTILQEQITDINKTQQLSYATHR